MLAYQVGDFDLGEAYMMKLEENMRRTAPGPTIPHTAIAMMIPMVARIVGTSDRFHTAEAAAEAVLSSPSTPLYTTRARIGLALMAVQRADVAAATEQFSALEPQRGTMLTALGFVVSADHLLGLLSVTMGNLDQAVAHFEHALAFCRKAGYRPELAWTCCDYADMLTERNAEGDGAKAMSLLDQSLATSSELGMRPLMERVLSRREILGA